MPRRGWSQLEVPSGWIQVSWPSSHICPVAYGKGAQFVRRSQATWLEAVSRSSADERHRQGPIEGYIQATHCRPPVPKPNLNPDKQLKAAQARVVKLEAAIVAIGDEDPAAAGLKEALAKARVQAQLRPVQDWIAHTEAFLDRSRKKMEALSAEVSRIQEVMAQLRTKIQDGVSWLEVLQTEAMAQASPFTVAAGGFHTTA